ncbi:hypothetical protein Hdeb2414_s0024g00647551 [Helianthus debilis subsp. tardiflorus]
MMESPPVTKRGSGSSESGGSESGAEGRTRFEYFGWVYHLGTNSIGREFCHLRFLYIRGKYVMMYKRDPNENPGIVWFNLISSLTLINILNIYLHHK